VVIAASACGGGDSSSDDIPIESDVLVESDNGLATLLLPAGSLPEGVLSDDVQLEVLVDETGEPGAPVVAVQLLPDGLVLAEAATLTVALPEALEEGFMAIHMAGDSIEFLGGDIQQDDEGVFSFQTSIGHFSLVGFYDVRALFETTMAVSPEEVSEGQTQRGAVTITAKTEPIVVWFRFESEEGTVRKFLFSAPQPPFRHENAEIRWSQPFFGLWDPDVGQPVEITETPTGWETSSASSTCVEVNRQAIRFESKASFNLTLLERGEPVSKGFFQFSQILSGERPQLPPATESSIELLDMSLGDTIEAEAVIREFAPTSCTDAADSGSITGDEDPTDGEPEETEPELDTSEIEPPETIDFTLDLSGGACSQYASAYSQVMEMTADPAPAAGEWILWMVNPESGQEVHSVPWDPLSGERVVLVFVGEYSDKYEFNPETGMVDYFYVDVNSLECFWQGAILDPQDLEDFDIFMRALGFLPSG